MTTIFGCLFLAVLLYRIFFRAIKKPFAIVVPLGDFLDIDLQRRVGGYLQSICEASRVAKNYSVNVLVAPVSNRVQK